MIRHFNSLLCFAFILLFIHVSNCNPHSKSEVFHLSSEHAKFGVKTRSLSLSTFPETLPTSSRMNPTSTLYHAIRFIDADTKNGIPIVTITSTYKTVYVSDSNGYIAFFEPGLMNRSLTFTVASSGYSGKKDPLLNIDCIQVSTVPGEETIVPLNRTQISERWFRLTGYGIYRDSVILGKQVPVSHPLLQNSVTGLDSVMGTFYQGMFYWFFGDTNRIDKQLGNFFATGAISKFGDISFGNASVRLEYISEGDFVKPVAKIEPFNQPTWIHDVIAVNRAKMRWLKHSKYENLIYSSTRIKDEVMYATYLKPETMTHEEKRGILIWNETKNSFQELFTINKDQNVWPIDGGHASLIGGRIYFSNPLPFVRTENYEALSIYETFSPLIEGTPSYEKKEYFQMFKFDRNEKGELNWNWKRNTGYISAALARQLYDSNILSDRDVAHWTMRDVITGDLVWPHAGNIAWNNYRKKYIMIFVQTWGSPSFLGEVWYAESASILGPWKNCIKVATHTNQDFYNPRIMHEFSEENDKIIYYMGTYVATFSGNIPTPYYDYNNQVHRIDLSDPRIQHNFNTS